MKILGLLFLAAVLSFAGLARLDNRSRAAERERALERIEHLAAAFDAARGNGAGTGAVGGTTTTTSYDARSWDALGNNKHQVRTNLGAPESTARDHYGGEIWTYPRVIVLFNRKGEVVEVTRDGGGQGSGSDGAVE